MNLFCVPPHYQKGISFPLWFPFNNRLRLVIHLAYIETWISTDYVSKHQACYYKDREKMSSLEESLENYYFWQKTCFVS